MTGSILIASWSGALWLVNKSVYGNALSVPDKSVESRLDAVVGRNPPNECVLEVNRHAAVMTGSWATASVASRESRYFRRIDGKLDGYEIETLKVFSRWQQAASLIA